jgi:mRNA interferase MazF
MSSTTPTTTSGLPVQQGDVYYVNLGPRTGSGPAGWHYVVILQSDTMNRTKVKTAVGCVLTSNLKRGKVNGNVTLTHGEGDLPSQSVVNISQIITLDKTDLVDKTGELYGSRMDEIIRNLHRVLLRGKRA